MAYSKQHAVVQVYAYRCVEEASSSRGFSRDKSFHSGHVPTRGHTLRYAAGSLCLHNVWKNEIKDKFGLPSLSPNLMPHPTTYPKRENFRSPFDTFTRQGRPRSVTERTLSSVKDTAKNAKKIVL